jgi:hypothetical protein
MLKEYQKIKVHLFDANGCEIITDCKDTVFIVKEKGGKLGIDFNTKILVDDIFTPFESFTNSVIFEDVSTQEKYYFDNIERLIKKY